jgi:type II secretory pathway component PulM
VNWQSSLTELRPLRSRLQASGAGPAANATQSLVVIVVSTLRSKNLDSALRRSQPTTTDGIRLEFENVVFDDLVLWLGELGSQFGLQVQSASFSNSASGTLGRVNASLTLER